MFAITDWITVIIAALALILSIIMWIWQLRVSHNTKVKAQADRISAWIDHSSHAAGSTSNVTIKNDSGSPIYEVVLTLVGMYGAGPAKHGEENEQDYVHRALYVIAPPGMSNAWIDTIGTGGMHVVCSIEIAFLDGSGRSWVRRGNGKLEQIKERPYKHYRIPMPANHKYSPTAVK